MCATASHRRSRKRSRLCTRMVSNGVAWAISGRAARGPPNATRFGFPGSERPGYTVVAARARREDRYASAMRLTLRPLTPERWSDLEALFLARGCSVARNSWCMYYRRTGERSLVEELTRREANRRDLKKLAASDPPAGLIGYR